MRLTNSDIQGRRRNLNTLWRTDDKIKRLKVNTDQAVVALRQDDGLLQAAQHDLPQVLQDPLQHRLLTDVRKDAQTAAHAQHTKREAGIFSGSSEQLLFHLTPAQLRLGAFPSNCEKLIRCDYPKSSSLDTPREEDGGTKHCAFWRSAFQPSLLLPMLMSSGDEAAAEGSEAKSARLGADTIEVFWEEMATEESTGE